MRLRALLFAVTVVVSTTSCEKLPAPKFKPGDRVRTIMGAEGVVALRTRFFVDDVYYVRLPGPDPEAASLYPGWWGAKQRYHYSGPYDAADLRLVSQ
jgi:hypothetical protein